MLRKISSFDAIWARDLYLPPKIGMQIAVCLCDAKISAPALQNVNQVNNIRDT